MACELVILALLITCSMACVSIYEVVCPVQSETSCSAEGRIKNLCVLLKTDDKSLQNRMRIRKHRKKKHECKNIELFKDFKDDDIIIINYCVARSQCYRIDVVDFTKNGTRDGWLHLVRGGTCASSNVHLSWANMCFLQMTLYQSKYPSLMVELGVFMLETALQTFNVPQTPQRYLLFQWEMSREEERWTMCNWWALCMQLKF